MSVTTFVERCPINNVKYIYRIVLEEVICMKIEAIKSKVINKYPDTYTEGNIEKIIEKIENLTPELRMGLEKFIETGDLPETEVEGWTVKKLKEERGMNEVASILTLDWLGREPKEAKETLEKGFDHIVSDGSTK